MDSVDADRIKEREIPFQELHPNPDQAATAAAFLAEVEGVLLTETSSPTLLRIRYDVLQLTLREIEEALAELGLHLDNGLLPRVKRALYDYTEETQRANLGYPRCKGNCLKQVFAKRYALIEHGCRDQRPEHWRRYL
ncbi:hypothetical protein [Marichromatium bheemlicum]|uniref:Uncharacterized protein n=1 Tax=Marichromatium bheemlicum TaxID=365339 RepID=A0ABX1I3S7_9GAMM|nr:hypothetical protein [Marichromatium bheemlicum]NKN32184.1 hypothetical protein [Marichromatium bheemlicum]